MKKRESNYELLRIVSAIAVIMLHVSGTYKDAITDETVFGYLYQEHMIAALLYNTLSRFAVPCFVMLSGAFLLGNDKNSNYKFFYKKCMKNVGIHTLLFSVLYFLFSESISCAKIVLRGDELTELLLPINDLVKGEPYYHMWYLYMILGIYLLIPMIIDFKKRVGEETFKKISLFLLPVATISGWTSEFVLHWSMAKVICYVGYLLIGYQIKILCEHNTNNKRGMMLILLGLIIECILTYIQYKCVLVGFVEENGKYSIVGNFNPLVVIASILIFVGFSHIKIHYDLDKVSSCTFYIYLFHAGVWSILAKIIKESGIERDARIIIPVSLLVVWGISHLLAIVYKRLWKKIEKRYSVSEKVLYVLGLN